MKAPLRLSLPVLACLHFNAALALADNRAGDTEKQPRSGAGPEATSTAPDEGVAASQPAPDDEAKQQARMHFKMGVKFYREGNYSAALVEFKRAYEAAPHYKVKFNLGQTALELNDYAYAIDNLTAYLREGGDDVPSERKDEVVEMIDQLNGRLAMVTIASNQDGALVYVDDRLVGQTPFAEPVPIGAGRRRIVALKDGYVTIEKRVSLAARDQVKLTLDFDERPKATRVVVTKIIDEGPSPVLWMGIGTGVVAAGTVALAVLTGVAKQEYEAEMGRETSKERLDVFKQNVDTRALLTDIGLGITSAAAIATVVVMLLEGDDEDKPKPNAKPSASTARVTPTIVPTLVVAGDRAGLGLSGRF